MNSAFSKVSNLKFNRVSKIAITLTSSTFFLYALGQSQIFKNILIKEKDFRDPVSHLFVAKSQSHQGLWSDTRRTCKTFKRGRIQKTFYPYHSKCFSRANF